MYIDNWQTQLRKGMLDIVIDGQTGYLFEPGNAIELAEKVLMALEHPWSNLREFVSLNFTLEQMVETTLQVYREVTDVSPDIGGQHS